MARNPSPGGEAFLLQYEQNRRTSGPGCLRGFVAIIGALAGFAGIIVIGLPALFEGRRLFLILPGVIFLGLIALGIRLRSRGVRMIIVPAVLVGMGFGLLALGMCYGMVR